MSYGVLAIDVRSPSLDLTHELRGTAAKFRPHVTIAPRMPSEHLGVLCRALAAWMRRTGEGPPIELAGPRWIASDLAWYECDVHASGWSWLREAHEVAMSTLASSGRPAGTDHRHVGGGYRPHLTVLWHCDAPVASTLPDRLIVTPVELTLYTYRREPRDGAVLRRPVAPVGHGAGRQTYARQ